ncbi:MAG: sodium:dicarboxylate symporter [Hoeflea sp.]|nr:sodium:dicarboxylate symporter [Hoeflea sp.]|tara:strand:- start:480 stop:1178 length:699 start_codon:yes stop_codon:yes gene_type:complete
MSSNKSRQISTSVLVAIAMVLGAAVGAWWVYGKGRVAGNGEATQTVQTETSEDAARCNVAQNEADALKPLAKGEIAAMAIQDPVRDMPSLQFKAADGHDVELDDFAGKALLVNFWATWCAPCRAEMPALAALQEKLGSENFMVLPINIDTGELDKPKAFLDEIGVSNLGLYHDETMGVFNKLKKEGLAYGLPATMLVDPEGCLIGVMNGPAEWAGGDGTKLIEEVIRQTKGA